MRYVHIWTDGNGEIGFDTPKFLQKFNDGWMLEFCGKSVKVNKY